MDYYLQKSAEAEARGDTEKAAKYAKNARDFAAAANYEAASGIMNEYGKNTGVSYDATAATRLNESTWQSYVDPAAVVQYDKSYVRTPATSYYAPMTVSTTLGESPAPASTTSLTGSGNNSSLSEPLRYQWDDSKGFFENIIEGTAYNFNKNIAEPLSTGGIAGLISNTPAYIEATKAEAGKAVDDYIDWSDSLVVSDNLGVRAAGTALAILAPNELIRNAKRITDGKADEITPEDIAWSALDALALVPGVALAKLGKVGKVTKIGAYGSQGVLAAVPAITAFNEAYNGTTDYAQLLANNESSGYNLVGDTDIISTPTYAFGSDTTGPHQVEYPGTQITPNAQYNPNYVLPNEQSTITPQNSEEMELSALLSAALSGIYSGKSSGKESGNGGVTIINETSGGSSTGLSEAIEQFAPYIIPTVLIIGGLIVFSNLGKSSNKKGAAA